MTGEGALQTSNLAATIPDHGSEVVLLRVRCRGCDSKLEVRLDTYGERAQTEGRFLIAETGWERVTVRGVTVWVCPEHRQAVLKAMGAA